MSNLTHLSHDWFSWPLPPNVIFGPRSWIYSSFAFLHCNAEARVRIGSDTGIYNGTFFELGSSAEVQIGNFCSIVGAVFNANGPVIVGDYVFLAHEVVITESQIATPPGARRRCSEHGQPITIGDNAWIGMRAILLSGATVGEGAIVGAAAVVDFEVPPYTIAAGNPARIVGHVSH